MLFLDVFPPTDGRAGFLLPIGCAVPVRLAVCCFVPAIVVRGKAPRTEGIARALCRSSVHGNEAGKLACSFSRFALEVFCVAQSVVTVGEAAIVLTRHFAHLTLDRSMSYSYTEGRAQFLRVEVSRNVDEGGECGGWGSSSNAAIPSHRGCLSRMISAFSTRIKKMALTLNRGSAAVLLRSLASGHDPI